MTEVVRESAKYTRPYLKEDGLSYYIDAIGNEGVSEVLACLTLDEWSALDSKVKDVFDKKPSLLKDWLTNYDRVNIPNAIDKIRWKFEVPDGNGGYKSDQLPLPVVYYGVKLSGRRKDFTLFEIVTEKVIKDTEKVFFYGIEDIPVPLYGMFNARRRAIQRFKRPFFNDEERNLTKADEDIWTVDIFIDELITLRNELRDGNKLLDSPYIMYLSTKWNVFFDSIVEKIKTSDLKDFIDEVRLADSIEDDNFAIINLEEAFQTVVGLVPTAFQIKPEADDPNDGMFDFRVASIIIPRFKTNEKVTVIHGVY